MSPVIRRARAEDAPAIGALYRELVADPLVTVVPEQIARLSRSSTSFLLIAEAGGIACGSVLLSICADVMYRAQPFGVVENVIVARTSRGNGIGRLMMAHVEQLASSQDCTKLMLLSSAIREEAHAFFRSCGFVGETKQAFVKYRSYFESDSSGGDRCL